MPLAGKGMLLTSMDIDPSLSKPLTEDPPLSDPGAGDWFVLIDATNTDVVSAAMAARFTGPAAFVQGTLVAAGSYHLMWDLARSEIVYP